MNRLVPWLLVAMLGVTLSAVAQPPQQQQPTNASAHPTQDEDFAYPLGDGVEGVTVALPADVRETYRLPAQITLQVAKTNGLLILPPVTVGKPAVVQSNGTVDLINPTDGKVRRDALRGEQVVLRLPLYNLEGTTDTRIAINAALNAETGKTARPRTAKPINNLLVLDLHIGPGGKPIATTTARLKANTLEQTTLFTVSGDAVQRLREAEAGDLWVALRGNFKSQVGVETLRVTAEAMCNTLTRITIAAKADPAPPAPAGKVLCLGGKNKQRLVVGTIFHRSLKIVVEEREGQTLDRALLDVLLGEVMGKLTTEATAADLRGRQLTVVLANGLALTGGLADIQKNASTILEKCGRNSEKLREAAEAFGAGLDTSFSFMGIGGSFGGNVSKSTASKDYDAQAVEELKQIANAAEGSMPTFVKLRTDAAAKMAEVGTTVAEASHRKFQIVDREYSTDLGFGWVVTDARKAKADQLKTQKKEDAKKEDAKKEKDKQDKLAEAAQKQADLDARKISEVKVTVSLPARKYESRPGQVPQLVQAGDDKQARGSHFVFRVYENDTLIVEERAGEGVKWDEGDTVTVRLPMKVEVLKNAGTVGRLEVEFVSLGEECIAGFSIVAWPKDGKLGRVISEPSKPQLWKNGTKNTVCEFKY